MDGVHSETSGDRREGFSLCGTEKMIGKKKKEKMIGGKEMVGGGGPMPQFQKFLQTQYSF